MTEQEKPGGLAAGLAYMGADFANTPFPYLLGLAFMFAAVHWDGHLHDQKGCFQLQEIKDRVFKVDTCTGKTEEIKISETQQPPNPSTTALPASK